MVVAAGLGGAPDIAEEEAAVGVGGAVADSPGVAEEKAEVGAAVGVGSAVADTPGVAEVGAAAERGGAADTPGVAEEEAAVGVGSAAVDTAVVVACVSVTFALFPVVVKECVCSLSTITPHINYY